MVGLKVKIAVRNIWISGRLLFSWFIMTLVLSYAWLNNHEFFFPFPEPLAIWLVDLYGAGNAEEVADLELLVALLLMGSISALVIAGGKYVLGRGRRRQVCTRSS